MHCENHKKNISYLTMIDGPRARLLTSLVLWMPRSDSRLPQSFFWDSAEKERHIGCGVAISDDVVVAAVHLGFIYK